MNEGRPYLQVWRGVWVPFCKIAIVTFISVRYKSDGLYCMMAGRPSSPTLFFIIIYVIYIPLDFSYLQSCDIKYLYISLQREYLSVKKYIYV